MDGPARPTSFLGQFKTPPAASHAAGGAPAPARGFEQAVLEAECERVRTAPTGARNDTLNRAAFNLGQVLPVNTFRAALVHAALSAGLTEPEAERTIESGLRGAARNPRSAERMPAATVPDVARRRDSYPQLNVEVEGQLELEGTETPERTTIDWPALWEDDMEQDWLLEPLIPAGRMVALYSAPKVGKSLLALEVAVAISRGDTVLGAPTQAVDVLYIDFENDPRTDVKSRLIAMGYGPRDLSRLHYASFPRLRPLDTAEGGIDLLQLVAQTGAQLVIIDTVSRVIKGKENDNDTWLDLYRCSFAHLKRNGVALLRLDHSGKDEERGMRGGSAKSGDVDAVWKLSALGPDMLQLDCEAHRIEMPEKRLMIRRATSPLRHEVDTRTYGKVREEQVLAALDAAGLPISAGRERARQALDEANIRVGNDWLASIVKRRQGLYAELQDS